MDQIRSLVGGIATAAGYELVDIELKGSGHQRVLRIFIDHESGISHEDCERVSRQAGTILDVEDLVPFAYTLEVSSPGLNRKLTRPEDFRRFEGRLVKVLTKQPLGDKKVFRGRLGGFDEGAIRLNLEPATGGATNLHNEDSVRIPMEVVREARLEVDWDSELHRSE